MAEALPAEPEVRTRSWWRWLAISLLAVVALVLVAVPLGLWWLAETPRGRAFVAEQVSGISPESGLRFNVGRIDGSLLSQFDLVDVVVSDLDGALAVIPTTHVSWKPITLFRSLVDVDSLSMPEVRLLRMWNLNPRNPDDPILPDIDIHIGRFEVQKLVLEKPLLGREEVIRTFGNVDIRSGRALLNMQADAAAGDRLLLLLDAEPDNNRFDLQADLKGPAGGMVATAAGIAGPIAVDLDGNGSWSQWRGRLNADIGAGDAQVRVAALAIDGENGTFRVRGDVNPAPFVTGTIAEVTKSGINLDLTAARDGDWFDVKLIAGSAAVGVAGGGRIDVKDNVLEAVRLTAVIRRPQAFHPQLSGDGIQASITADGPLQDANIVWTARARTLRFAGETGPMGADGLNASGTVQLANGSRPLTMNVSASAARTVGLPPETAALLVQPRFTGTVVMAGDLFRLNNARLVTTKLDVRGSGTMTTNGRITAAVDGRVARFDIPQLGAITARAVANIAIVPGQGPAVTGTFEGRALTLANASAAEFLGGLPAMRGNFALASNGRIAASGVNFTSPNLKFAGAKGSYDPASGQFTLVADGSSRQYGPVSIVASGTSTQPTATIRMPKPDFGFGITNLLAEVRPAPGGVFVTAKGDSPEGPLDARMTVLFGEGRPLTLDIQRASFAGMVARGRVTQTAAGPFQGQLLVGGRGLTAKADLLARGRHQQIDAVASAINARIPLDPPISIGKGAARFTVVLVPGKPEISGSFRASGVRREGLVLTEVEGAANLAGLGGQAVITAKGRAGDGQAFTATSRVQSVGEGYALTLDGMMGKLPLKLERPAQIVKIDGGWELRATRLILPQGQLDIAGSYGKDTHLRMVMRNVDLGIADFFTAGSGLGGVANGQLSIRLQPGERIPTGQVDLSIKGLRRSGVTGFTIPTDIRVVGNSDGERLLLGGSMKVQDRELGRLVLRVDPGAGETPTERFMEGRLTGGIRFNGPIEPIWALAQLEGQELRGALAIGADLAGTPASPSITGVVRGKGMIYRHATFGTELTELALDGSFTGSTFMLKSLTGRANGGTLSGSGFVRLAADADPQVNLKLELQQARLANSDMISLVMSGPLALTGRMNDATLTGDLVVDEARIQIMQLESSEVPQLQVRRAGEVHVPAAGPALAASSLKLDLRVRSDDRIRVEGMGLDSRWRVDARVRGNASAPLLLGSATLAEGDFSFASSDFEITRGRVVFNGQPLESAIDIQAQTQAGDVLAMVNIGGTAGQPEVRFSSTPSLPEDEILSRLLFGTSVADLSVTEALQLATAVAGLQSGTDTMGKIRRSVGLDRLRLVGDDSRTGMGTGIAIGKRISRNIYVEVITDSQGNTLTSLQLTLSRVWSLFIEVSSQGKTSANIRHQREY